MALPMIKPVNIPGGRVPPAPKPTAPRAPRQPAPPKLSMQQTATKNAMNAFHTALAQLQGAIPAVDQNAVYAPYRASEAVAGQLGTGLQNSIQQAGQAASAQYTTGLGDAQKQAAQFGIAAGGAPTQLQNNGTGQLATQTNAYSSAAPAAAAAWQALLERTGAQAVSNANLNRSNTIASGDATLAGNIPTAIRDEETLANQKSASEANNAYLRSSLSQKGQAEYDSNLLKQEGINAGITKTKLQQSGANSRNSASITAANSRSANSITAANQRSNAALKAKTKTATAAGLKGVAAITAAITKTTTTKGAKPITGYEVTYPSDPNGVNAGAPSLTTYVPAGKNQQPPTGYLSPLNQGKPVYGQATGTSTKGGGGLSASQWDTYMRTLLAQNPGATAAIKAYLGPRPKK